MSLFKSNLFINKQLIIIALLSTLLLVSACQVRPVYGTINNNNGQSTQATLSNIYMIPERKKANLYIRQALVKNGVSSINAPASSRFQLKINTREYTRWIAVENISGRPSTIFYTVDATAILTDTQTNKVLLNETFFAKAGYDWTGQRFANDKAREDAEKRAATTVARQIELRLATVDELQQSKLQPN